MKHVLTLFACIVMLNCSLGAASSATLAKLCFGDNEEVAMEEPSLQKQASGKERPRTGSDYEEVPEQKTKSPYSPR